jgi:hypothetical protein
MAQYKVYKDMQKAEQSQITPFINKSSIHPSALHSVLFNHPH